MKKWFMIMEICICLWVEALCPAALETEGEFQNLYARSAVLLDGSSGRVLFGKKETEVLPMASTTKIMTCILVLENVKLNEIACVSDRAAAQPKVHLGAMAGTKFYVKDLLYSMMLESHNDSAVILAEHVDGTVEKFAERMNRKAKELGCSQTHFVTPNGLDAEDETAVHATTAQELARIMKYCVWESPEKEMFLEIAQTRNYSFTDINQRQEYYCSNHNSFLDMQKGIVAGKTGYTSAAGYCYVCAAEFGERRFVGVVLACGWPYNRSYKWQDMKKIITYGASEYKTEMMILPQKIPHIAVKDGIPDSGNLCETAYTGIEIDTSTLKQKELLVSDKEEIRYLIHKKSWVQAPVKAKEKVGELRILIDNELIQVLDLRINASVRQKTWNDWFVWTIQKYVF